MNSDLDEFLNTDLPTILDCWQQPGAAISIVTPSGKQITHCHGVRTATESDEVNSDTNFAIASCTKSFAAGVYGHLVERGIAGWDDKVLDYIPNLAFSRPDIVSNLTVRDLLCHRLGLISSENRHRQAATSRKDLISRMKKQPFRHEFRQAFGYCTDAYTILGEVSEIAANQPWEEVCHDVFLRPLEMLRTNVNHRESVAGGNVALPHLRAENGPVPIDFYYEDHVAVPAGGINSNANDLLRWLDFWLGKGAVDGQSCLSPFVVSEILTPQIADKGEFADREMAGLVNCEQRVIRDESYCLGWYCHRDHEQLVYYHSGSIDGFGSIVGFLPSVSVGVAVLLNTSSGRLQHMLFHIITELLCGREWRGLSKRLSSSSPQIEKRPPYASDCSTMYPLKIGKVPSNIEGSYQDGTGFGDAEILYEQDQLLLRISALHFSLGEFEDNIFAAIKVAPTRGYSKIDCKLDIDEKGGVVGFSMSSGARFRKKTPERNIQA